VLIMITASFGCDPSKTSGMQLFRDTTQIFMGDAAGSRARSTFEHWIDSNRDLNQMSACYLDSPSSTSEVEYSMKWFSQSAVAIYLNKAINDNDGAEHDQRTASSITAIEVLA